jgi:uridine kinase
LNILDLFQQLSKKQDETFLIAIAGCRYGAGKSTLAAAAANIILDGTSPGHDF